jgi:predicted metal-dependent hydrolase
LLFRLTRRAAAPPTPPPKPTQMVVDGQTVTVAIRRHAQSRSMRLRYDAGEQAVRITIPTWATEREAMALAHGHRDWIARQMERAVPPQILADGAQLMLYGRAVRIEWRADHRRTPFLTDTILQVGGAAESLAPRVLRWLQAEAKRTYANDLAFYCARAGVSVPNLSIGDARSRWGSCSTRGGIRMNWRLIMAPPDVRQSVIAHEVAHLSHMDHSPRFYAHLDAVFDGDRRQCDAWLKAHGRDLRAIG